MRPVYEYPCLSQFLFTLSVTYIGVEIGEEGAEHAAPAGPYGPVMDLGTARQGR